VAPGEGEAPTTGEKHEASSNGISFLRSVRHWSTGDYTRVAIDLDARTQYKRFMLDNPARLCFDIHGSKLSPELGSKPYVVDDEFLKQIRLSQNRPDVVRVVLDLTGVQDYSVSELSDPFRIIIDIRGNNAAPPGSDQSRPSGNQGTPEAPETHGVQPTPDKSEGRLTPGLTVTEADVIPRPVPVSTRQPIRAAESKPPDPQVELARERLSLDPPRGVKPPPMPSKPKHPASHATPAHVDSSPVAPVPAESTASKTIPAGRDPEPPPATKASDVKSASVETPKAAALTSKGDRTLTRVLGLKIRRIVLDPGHGGHDTGTIGRNGLKEKDLVLEVARQLEKLLQERLNAEVVLTRTDDTFIPLEERTSFANYHQADVFVSIHANSSGSRAVSGVETYYLNFATSLDAQEVAARENSATSRNIRDLPDMVKSITKADKSAESRELAYILQKKLYGSAQRLFPASRNRGVRTAPFVVLIGANMPSVLAEVGFVSNLRDEKLLKKIDSRKRLAEALYAGIEGYMKSLGSQVTQASTRGKGSAP
jgi:N-acetylmuramoyl-L-alanine amidase